MVNGVHVFLVRTPEIEFSRNLDTARPPPKASNDTRQDKWEPGSCGVGEASEPAQAGHAQAGEEELTLDAPAGQRG